MAQDNAPNKPVHLIFLGGGVILFLLLKWTTEWIWGYFTRMPDEFVITSVSGLIAIVGGLYLYRNERVFGFVIEVANEMKKVTWPTGKEVKSATIVVVVMTIVSSIILGSFDLVWSQLTRFIYGG